MGLVGANQLEEREVGDVGSCMMRDRLSSVRSVSEGSRFSCLAPG